MSNATKNSIMVYQDLTDRELELISFLVEAAVGRLLEEDVGFIEQDGVLLFTAQELEGLWAKVENAQDKLDKKLAGLGIVTDTFTSDDEEIIDISERSECEWDWHE